MHSFTLLHITNIMEIFFSLDKLLIVKLASIAQAP